jgi:hypothetical protein
MFMANYPLRPITQEQGTVNVLDEIAQQIRTATAEAEATWTYREVCAQVLNLLDEIVQTEESPSEAGRIGAALLHSLQLARAVLRRDATLGGVILGLVQLSECVSATMSLSDPSVQRTVEAVLLDIMLCLSEH